MGGLGSAIGSAIGGVVGGVGSIVGGLIGANSAQQTAGLNYDAQKEFAQNGIRWKVADAKAAGIHPLYALGASTPQFSPVQGYGGDYGISDALNSFGQGINRAVEAKQTKEERDRLEVEQALRDMVVMKQMRQQDRMNDAQIRLIDSEIARNMAAAQVALKRTGLPPAMPSVNRDGIIPGQGESYATGQTQPEISEVVTSVAGLPSVQAGNPPDVRFYNTSSGRAPLPTEASGDAMDAAFGSGIQWALRNNLLPYLANFFPIDDPHRRDGEYYDLVYGEYRKGKRIRDYFGY